MQLSDEDAKDLIRVTARNQATIEATQRELDKHILDCAEDKKEVRDAIKSLRKTFLSIGGVVIIKLLGIIGMIVWYFFTYFWNIKITP